MDTLITNIQRCAVHDGSGIRTVIFFKGCPLNCQWCHNPETLAYNAETAFYPERCAGCVCCTFQDDSICPYAAKEITGRAYTPAALAKLALRDSMFFTASGGGITLSGGEPLARDTRYLVELLTILKQNDIHIACDTSGDVPWEQFTPVLPYIDHFLYDIKTASSKLHQQFTGRGNERILANLSRLCGTTNISLRIPVIGGVNDGNEMERIIATAANIAPPHHIKQVSLLPYHATGTGKRERLGMSQIPANFYTPSAERMEVIAALWKQAGYITEIGG